jgi:serine/threonine protein kinase
LKPENLLYESEYEDSHLKLADFGLSKILRRGKFTMNTLCGTVGYCGKFNLRQQNSIMRSNNGTEEKYCPELTWVNVSLPPPPFFLSKIINLKYIRIIREAVNMKSNLPQSKHFR